MGFKKVCVGCRVKWIVPAAGRGKRRLDLHSVAFAWCDQTNLGSPGAVATGTETDLFSSPLLAGFYFSEHSIGSIFPCSSSGMLLAQSILLMVSDDTKYSVSVMCVYSVRKALNVSVLTCHFRASSVCSLFLKLSPNRGPPLKSREKILVKTNSTSPGLGHVTSVVLSES